MSFKCPNCEATLHSRVHRLCLACGVALPAELLLPENQIRYFEEKSRREREAEREADSNVNVQVPESPPIPPGEF